MRGKLTGFIRRTGTGLLFVMLCMVLSLAGQKQRVSAKTASWERQMATELYQAGKFTVSSEKITLQETKDKGILITGNAKQLSKAVFQFGDLQDFEANVPEYMLVDALGERKKKITLEFYLDHAKKPFCKVELARQKRKDSWNVIKNRCIDLSGAKLKGKSQITFRVVTEETGKISLLLRSITFMKNDLPTVIFDLDESQGSIAQMNSDSEHDTECYGNVTLRIPEGYQSEYTDKKCETATYTLDYIRGRGNSTWMADKKPYKFKLEEKIDLLGMGKSRHWVLLANHYDITMLRNKFTYWLGERLGMEFTPQCEFVDVVMNGEYLGSYYLCEQIRVEESRIAIDDLEKNASTSESDISGGYLLSMYPYGDENREGFITDGGLRFLIESPSFETSVNEAQVNYIRDYVQKTENAIMGKDFRDENGKSYQTYLDIDSAVDYYWLQEFSMNGDAFGSTSTYLYKKKDGKLYWGPLWDFDFVAWGATEYRDCYCTGFTQNNNAWYGRMFEDPLFYKKVMERYATLREILLEACKDGGQIDIYSAKQYESQKHNYEIWKKYSDMYDDFMWEENQTEESKVEQITYDSEVARFKKWILARIEWIDANLDNLKKEYYTLTFMVDDLEFATLSVEKEYSLVEFPETPYKEGYLFKGWFVSTPEGEEDYPFFGYEAITEDMTLKAEWIKESEIVPAEQVVFSKEEYSVLQYDTFRIPHCILPFDAYQENLIWESSNEEIVTVEDGIVMTQGETGDVVVTATAANGISASCTVHVLSYEEYVGLRNFEPETPEISVKAGEYKQLPIIYEPVNAIMYSELIYASTDEEIAKINECGIVYGAKAGTAVIVCCLPDIGIRFCKVTVTD